MDLSEIKTIERVVEILHPSTKEPIGVSVTLMSPRDPRLDKLRNSIAQQQLQAQMKNKVEKIDDLKSRRLRILIAAIVSWEWEDHADWRGEKPDLNIKVLTDISETQSWFVEQIDEAFGEVESFFMTVAPD